MPATGAAGPGEAMKVIGMAVPGLAVARSAPCDSPAAHQAAVVESRLVRSDCWAWAAVHQAAAAGVWARCAPEWGDLAAGAAVGGAKAAAVAARAASGRVEAVVGMAAAGRAAATAVGATA